MSAASKKLESETGSKENFIQIGVYFQSLNTKLIYEEPKYYVSYPLNNHTGKQDYWLENGLYCPDMI